MIIDYSKNSEILQIFWKSIEAKFKELFNGILEKLVDEENLLHKRIFFQI